MLTESEKEKLSKEKKKLRSSNLKKFLGRVGVRAIDQRV